MWRSDWADSNNKCLNQYSKAASTWRRLRCPGWEEGVFVWTAGSTVGDGFAFSYSRRLKGHWLPLPNHPPRMASEHHIFACPSYDTPELESLATFHNQAVSHHVCMHPPALPAACCSRCIGSTYPTPCHQVRQPPCSFDAGTRGETETGSEMTAPVSSLHDSSEMV